MTKPIRVIGVASGLGALDSGCEHGPAAVQRAPGWAALVRYAKYLIMESNGVRLVPAPGGRRHACTAAFT